MSNATKDATTDTTTIDTCVIGAGVVGLAIARALAEQGHEVLILDAAGDYGEGISSRNSEVIHAGIYYPTGSLKAELCVRGKSLLYEFCESHGVSYRRIGKLIVACDSNEAEALGNIKLQAEKNGVTDLDWRSADQLKKLEPALAVESGLWSPSTGIVSAHEFMTALLGDAERAGASLALHAKVQGIGVSGHEFEVRCLIDNETYRFSARRVVNAAGLGAQSVAASIDAFPAAKHMPLYFCKGNYFVYSGTSPFSHLIYPVPEPGGAGLGVHATIDLGGQARFGPDVEYVAEPSYDVSMARYASSVAAIKRYFPGLSEAKLSAGYAGIRPKIVPEGAAAADFVIQTEELHGIPGLVNLFGIESPGLTASLAIAENIAERLQASA